MIIIDFTIALGIVLITTAAVIQSIGIIVGAVYALAGWIEDAFFHEAGTQNRRKK